MDTYIKFRISKEEKDLYKKIINKKCINSSQMLRGLIAEFNRKNKKILEVENE